MVQLGEYLILRADGTEERVPKRPTIQAVHEAMKAVNLSLDSFTISRDPPVLAFVVDCGHELGLPVNKKATNLYLERCRPGTDWQIRGDVVIVNDGDFA